MVSSSVVAVGAILLSIALVVCAGVLRSRHPSNVDIYLDATAWMILGITLGTVVARAVFAPGPVKFHRVVGAVLLYLCIGLVFVSLFCLVALNEPWAFNGLAPLQDNPAVAGNLIYFSFVTLTSVGYGDIVPVHPFARGLANVELYLLRIIQPPRVWHVLQSSMERLSCVGCEGTTTEDFADRFPASASAGTCGFHGGSGIRAPAAIGSISRGTSMAKSPG
jgi:Ion channel